MAKPKLPPETCQECGTEIRASARVNVIDNRIVCTRCWKKLDVERQWNGPATEQQIAYARDLGLRFSVDITKQEMSDLLSRKLDYDDEPPAPDWLFARAVEMGVARVTRCAGYRQLYNRIFEHLREDNGSLALWFVENVANEVASGSGRVTPSVMKAIAQELANAPHVMKSMRRYQGADLADFGTSTDSEGWMRTGGSQATIAYKAARERLASLSGR